jgi:hypothetical protein
MIRESSIPDHVSAQMLARWLGVSGKTIYELAKVGIAVRAGGDLYKLEESVRRYCEHIRRTASTMRSNAADDGAVEK